MNNSNGSIYQDLRIKRVTSSPLKNFRVMEFLS